MSSCQHNATTAAATIKAAGLGDPGTVRGRLSVRKGSDPLFIAEIGQKICPWTGQKKAGLRK